MSSRRVWLALLGVAVAYAASFCVRHLLPAPPAGNVIVEGSFKPGGEYPGEPLALKPAPRTWASWSGDDANTGTLRIGPFPAPERLRIAISGYPHQRGGNSLHLEMAELGLRFPIDVGEIGERWHIEEIDIPFGWRGRRVTLVAVDNSREISGWLGVSEPLIPSGGRVLEHGFLASLAAWLINGALLGFGFVAAARAIRRHGWLPEPWVPLGAGAAIALCGYGAFWIYFTHPLAGRTYSLVVLAAALLAWARLPGREAGRNETPASTAEWRGVAGLMVLAGVLYLGVLHLFSVPRDIYDLAANRFVEALPGDNRLPHDLAVRLYHGDSLRDLSADWLSSDRPPLQTGWQLLTWPVTHWLGFGETTASATSGVWLQLLWVCGAYGLLRTLGLGVTRSRAWTAVLTLSGFFLQNSIFTWPKLPAAALGCGAFALWILRKGPRDQETKGPRDTRTKDGGTSFRRSFGPLVPWSLGPFLIGGIFAALAWLSHGGIAFSFLALVPWAAWRALRGELRGWLLAALAFTVLAAPWIAYQRFYDPPANRLLKWHLAGQIDKDPRGTWQTIREAYAATPWNEIRDIKLFNLKFQFHGDWLALLDVSRAGASERRQDEFYHTFRALGWSLLGVALLSLVFARAGPRAQLFRHGRSHAILALWTLLTLVVWCLLLFLPTAVIILGSYGAMLTLFVLVSAWAELAGRAWLGVVAVLQAFTFVTTWLIGNAVIHGPVDPIAATAAAIAAGVLAVLVGRELRRFPCRAGGIPDTARAK